MPDVQKPYPPRLLSENDAARYLSISKGTLRKLGLPRIPVGARRLFDRAALDAWVDELPHENAIPDDDADNGDWG